MVVYNTILTLGKLRQEGYMLAASLVCIEKGCLNRKLNEDDTNGQVKVNTGQPTKNCKQLRKAGSRRGGLP